MGTLKGHVAREFSGLCGGAVGQEAAGLHVPHVGIVPLLAQELEVGSLFDDLALIEDQDPVHFCEAGEAVGDNNCGAVGHEGFQAVLDVFFRAESSFSLCSSKSYFLTTP